MGDLRRRLIAFDLDGTLIDSSRDLVESVNAVLGERGVAALPEGDVTRMIGDGAGMLVERALRAAGASDGAGALDRFLAIYDARLLRHTRPYDGVVEVVRAVRGRARVAVLTNKPRAAAETVLVGLGLRDLFDDVVGGDGPAPRKPDPAGLLALVGQAGVGPGDALMVGDSRVDYETASRAATRCCLVAYGFGFHSLDGVSTGDAAIVHDVAGLAAVVSRFADGG